MSDDDQLREVIETNFRLGVLYTRQMGAQMDQRMDALSDGVASVGQGLAEISEQMTETSEQMAEISRRVAETSQRVAETAKKAARTFHQLDDLAAETRAVGKQIRADFDALADRQDDTLEILRKMGDSSVDIHQEIAELKRRVTELENKAS